MLATFAHPRVAHHLALRHPDDLVWLVELTAPALRRQYLQSQRAYGIDDSMLDAAIAVIVDCVTADGPQTREQLRARLQGVGLPAADPALPRLPRRWR